MNQNCLKNVTFWTEEKVKEKDSGLKISFPVGQIDRKNRKNKIQLLPNQFGDWFRNQNPNMC